MKRYARRGEVAAQRARRIGKRLEIERRVAGDCETCREALSAAACPTGTLIVVGDRVWNIGHQHGFDRADVDTHFHGGRAGEQVDIAFLELLLEDRKSTRLNSSH